MNNQNNIDCKKKLKNILDVCDKTYFRRISKLEEKLINTPKNNECFEVFIQNIYILKNICIQNNDTN